VLKRVKPQIGEVRCLGVPVYPEYAALFVDIVKHGLIILTYIGCSKTGNIIVKAK
jgi:hypothetical protein